MASVFRVDAKNQLGLDFQKTRSKLLAIALSKPESYYTLRENVITAITESSVEQAYNSYWNLLTKGVYNKVNEDGTSGGVGQLVWPTDGKEFEPNLPESEVNKFALKVARAVQEIAEEAVDEILPMDIDSLAKRKSKSLLEAKNIHV